MKRFSKEKYPIDKYDHSQVCTFCGKPKYTGKFPAPCESGTRKCYYEDVKTQQ